MCLRINLIKTAGLISELLAVTALIAAPCAFAQGTTFTYQGQLDDGGEVAEGVYDMEFEVWNASSGGSQVGGTDTHYGIPVDGGLFTVELDFGSGIFTGPDRWLQIGVQTNGGGGFTTLTPRTMFNSTPYAIRAMEAAGVPSSSINSADVLNNSLTSNDLGPNSVGTSEVINDSLMASDLAANSVGTSEVMNESLTAADLAPSSVGAAEIAANAVGQSEIATGGVASSEVVDNSLTANDLAVNSVGASEIVANAVGQSEITMGGVASSEVLDGSLTTSDLNLTSIDARYVNETGDTMTGSLALENALYLKDGTQNAIWLGEAGVGGYQYLYNRAGKQTVYLDGDSSYGGVIYIRNTNGSNRAILDGYGSSGGGSLQLYADDGSQTVGIHGEYGGAGVVEIENSSSAVRVRIDGENANSGGQVSVYESGGDEVCRMAADSAGGELRLYDDAGEGTVLVDSSGAGGGYATFYQADGQNGVFIDGHSSSGEGLIYIYEGGGTAAITLDGDYNGTGDSRIITDELQIKGGSDLSEQFDIQTAAQPGSVVCIDAANPGKLVVSSKSYDRTVAGIVSGAGGVKPGMMMGQDGSIADGEHPVALSGRVYCRVDTSQGTIQPGDLITTSDIPGHGMKVSDHSRAHGAIIGKAMTGLESGQGLVLVLVSLH